MSTSVKAVAALVVLAAAGMSTAPASAAIPVGTFSMSGPTQSHPIILTTPDYKPDAVAAVPEPATWAMMIGGMALVGVGMRRSRAVRTKIA